MIKKYRNELFIKLSNHSIFRLVSANSSKLIFIEIVTSFSTITKIFSLQSSFLFHERKEIERVVEMIQAFSVTLLQINKKSKNTKWKKREKLWYISSYLRLREKKKYGRKGWRSEKRNTFDNSQVKGTRSAQRIWLNFHQHWRHSRALSGETRGGKTPFSLQFHPCQFPPEWCFNSVAT